MSNQAELLEAQRQLNSAAEQLQRAQKTTVRAAAVIQGIVNDLPSVEALQARISELERALGAISEATQEGELVRNGLHG
jgi:ABC-type transporter Mla subunit MlaD